MSKQSLKPSPSAGLGAESETNSDSPVKEAAQKKSRLLPLGDVVATGSEKVPMAVAALLAAALVFYDSKHPDRGAPWCRMVNDAIIYKSVQFTVSFLYFMEVEGVVLSVTRDPYKAAKLTRLWVSIADLRSGAGNLMSMEMVKL